MSTLRNSLLSGVAVALALVITGRLLTPATSWWSSAAALAILVAYGGMARLGPDRLNRCHPDILRGAIVFGLLAGAIFVAEVILEYVLLPKDNSRYGMVEFGTVLGLYAVAGFVSGRRLKSVKSAVLTSVGSAFIASLVWVIVVLAVFYVFHGSHRQALVLRAEGDYEDFAHSGMSNFDAFIMEDFMGATFFHLSLGLIVAAILGAVAGLIGKGTAVAREERRE